MEETSKRRLLNSFNPDGMMRRKAALLIFEKRG